MTRLKRWLRSRAEKQRQNLHLVLGGASVCFVGLALIYYAEQALADSLHRELVALAGLAFTATGVILAATGYIGLSLLRILQFIGDDHDPRQP